ncbi:MAG: alpha-1,4-glucan--maltose-1-phosphate maltosyltransferase [Deltaproteobacteria bacterium]|nr:alpha-1,4-glucan--maltose-1-phosphate maltosyltransferase [Deltaproteobacteria bacterium]
MIDAVEPSLGCGRYPVKRIVGEPCRVRATIFRDGPDAIRAAVTWWRDGGEARNEAPLEPVNPGLDRWEGQFPLEENGRYRFSLVAWTDPYATWVDELRRRVEGGSTDIPSALVEGAKLLEAAAARGPGADGARLSSVGRDLRRPGLAPGQAYAAASAADVVDLMRRLQARDDAVTSDPLEVVADRPRARVGAWYELFPRSQSPDPSRGGTLRDAEARLDDLHDLGFDVVYLPPVHPIGFTHRKGRNNALHAGPTDPGSPWAVGNQHGGHEAIEPSLGTVADFERFCRRAHTLGMEVALDLAVQCSPDHPWVHDHPEWFYRRPDGTIKYAENPPKKYEDIHPLNFDCDARAALWKEMRRLFQVWIDRGVTLFRVDNPHTKPVRFWRWLIEDIQARHPEVLFLAEAFTRPPMMKELARIGFTQSYTYFTWRNGKRELVDYLTELTQSGMQEYFRPNFFANTPDILHEYLQRGDRPAFKVRLTLAATLSPSYGIYSGFELCENVAVRAGSEEYLDSEKYEVRHRDWRAPGNIRDYVRLVNRIRRDHPALQEFTNLRFLPTDSEHILCYAKATADRADVVIVSVNLDPFAAHECMVRVPLEELGLPSGGRFVAHDLVSDQRWGWNSFNYVRLDPAIEPAHIIAVER